MRDAAACARARPGIYMLCGAATEGAAFVAAGIGSMECGCTTLFFYSPLPGRRSIYFDPDQKRPRRRISAKEMYRLSMPRPLTAPLT